MPFSPAASHANGRSELHGRVRGVGAPLAHTAEAETAPVVKEKMLHANSRQTVRSRSRTGKYTRQLRSSWTDAWHQADSPDPLPMPLQALVSEPALSRVSQLAEGGHNGAKQLATYFVGQGVGLMNSTISARQVGSTSSWKTSRRRGMAATLEEA